MMPALSPSLDLSIALDLAGGEEDLLREILTLFLDDCPAQLRALREAAATGNSQALARTAHSLKGALQTIGARRAGELAATLEQGEGDMLPALERELDEVLRAATEACRSSEHA